MPPNPGAMLPGLFFDAWSSIRCFADNAGGYGFRDRNETDVLQTNLFC